MIETLGCVLPLLPRPRTTIAALDALLARIERGDVTAAAEVTAAWAPRVLARLTQATRGIGALQDLQATAPALFQEAFRAQEPRRCAIEMLARALAPHLALSGVEAALVELFATHPWHLARVAVGRGLLAGAPTTGALAQIATAMDDASLLLWVRHTGVAAAVRLDPRTAFDRLAPRFADELARGTDLARGLFVALAPEALKWPAPPIDPRFYPLLARAFVTDGVIAGTFFASHPQPAAVRAALDVLEERTRTRASWLLYLGTTLSTWKRPETVPALLAAVAAAIDTADERLTGPLDVLEAIGDGSVVPALRELASRATREAQPALDAAIASLTRAAPTAPRAARRAASEAPPDPDRTALAARLTAAGFTAARVRDLVALARPRILVRARRATRAVPPGASRFGGAPDLPAGFAWPRHGRTPLAFVGQLDLRTLAAHDLARQLPSTGVLSFFVRQDITVDKTGDLAVLASRVCWFEGPALPRARFPAALAVTDRHRAATLACTHDLPPPPPAVAARLGLVSSEVRAYEAIADEPDAPHAVLGHARAGYYRGLPAATDALLLHVATDSAPGFLWGDASSIFFVIDAAALAARRFDLARCLADEC
ncbi:MAG: DUF1963 domain-containing protein [Deltaproteobacteria bacterium]|nr:DUF1963 domain-containing protein [Deltaproteobacteria bacterium]